MLEKSLDCVVGEVENDGGNRVGIDLLKPHVSLRKNLRPSEYLRAKLLSSLGRKSELKSDEADVEKF